MYVCTSKIRQPALRIHIDVVVWMMRCRNIISHSHRIVGRPRSPSRTSWFTQDPSPPSVSKEYPSIVNLIRKAQALVLTPWKTSARVLTHIRASSIFPSFCQQFETFVGQSWYTKCLCCTSWLCLYLRDPDPCEECSRGKWN